MDAGQDLKLKLQLADETDFAKLRGVTISALRNERSRGMGPPYQKVGNRVFYRISDIQKFLLASTVKPVALSRTLINENCREHVSKRQRAG